MASPPQSKATQGQRVDDGLDKIPMQKMSPAWIVAGILGVLAVGGLVVANLAGGQKTSEAKNQSNQVVSAEPEQMTDAKAQSEHRAMTERALAALETKKKEQAAAEASSQAPAAPSAESGVAAKPASGAVKRSGGGPVPKGADLDKLGEAAVVR